MKRHTRAALAAVVLAAVVATLVATAAFAQPSATAGTRVQVKGGEFYFKLSSKSVRHGTVTFVFQNAGHVAHDFKIDGKKTKMVQPGKSATLVVRFAKRGTYPYLCTVPGHAQAGMKGVLRVT